MDEWKQYTIGIKYRLMPSTNHKCYEIWCHDIVSDRRWELTAFADHISFPSLGNCSISSADLMAAALNAAVQLSKELREDTSHDAH